MKKSKLETLPKRESRHVEFKESFDVSNAADWCEIIKDIVSIANSGGGELFIGLKNSGHPSGSDVASVVALDPAQVTDKIAKYTGEQFADFEIKPAQTKTGRIAVMSI